MKERPILFSAPMVRAILAGRKTQTRRLVKPQPIPDERFVGGHYIERKARKTSVCAPYVSCESPYGQPCDRLWVREAWGLHAYFDTTDWLTDSCAGIGDEITSSWELAYRADWGPLQDGCHWRPSIHMPRWASRILLEIVSVRVELLNDISEADSLAEGVSATCDGAFHLEADGFRSPTASETFARLWESINGAGSWESNPWVWVVEFRKAP